MGSVDDNSPRPPRPQLSSDDADLSTQASDADSEVERSSLSDSSSEISSLAVSILLSDPIGSDAESSLDSQSEEKKY